MRRILYILMAVGFMACGHVKKSTNDVTVSMQPVGPAFSADSAWLFCQQQCDFGPRAMNTSGHEQCRQWIVDKFRQYGLQVQEQKATLTGYDGTPLNSTNIIAVYLPEQSDRILLCAHWDSRPWADNDPDSANWRKPILAANDAASGVAVMLEVARLLQKTDSLRPKIGIDFVCFDAEDWGVPQWTDTSDGDSWALGAQYWAQTFKVRPDKPNYRYGILLDMVGGQGARFYQEQLSKDYAPSVVSKVWQAAEVVGYGSFFVRNEGVGITDDHLPVNQVANIPCIDIIPYYPDCEASSFGPTWHTLNDDMEHLDKNTLQAVGQTIIQVIFSEK
jgi:hypothetical protein